MGLSQGVRQTYVPRPAPFKPGFAGWVMRIFNKKKGVDFFLFEIRMLEGGQRAIAHP